MILVNLGVRRRRLVRIMRVVQVNPNETRTGRMRSKPPFRVFDYLASASLEYSPMSFRFRPVRKIVVKVEPPIQSRSETLRVEDDGADECRRLIAALLQQFGPRVMCRGERNPEITYSVDTGQQSGQDTRVRRVCDRTDGKCLEELDTIFRDAIQRRRANLRISEAVN